MRRLTFLLVMLVIAIQPAFSEGPTAPYEDDRPPTHCGDGVRGEIIEGGLDIEHPEYKARMIHHGDLSCSKILGSWHGTIVFGVAFAGDVEGSDSKGMLPCAEGIIADKQKFLELSEAGRKTFTEGTKDTFKASFQSRSWGTDCKPACPDYSGLAKELDSIVFDIDIPVLNAAGNDGYLDEETHKEERRVQDGPEAKNIITVGGVIHGPNTDDSDDRHCGHDCSRYTEELTCMQDPYCIWPLEEGECLEICGNVGPTVDLRIKPDVVNWVDNIRTTYYWPPETCPYHCWGECDNPCRVGCAEECEQGCGDYCPPLCRNDESYTDRGSGTSSATPMTAGVLGLIVDLWGDGYNGARNPWGVEWPDPVHDSSDWERQPHSSTLKALLINSARQYQFSYPDDLEMDRVHQGWGRPNALEALRRAAGSLVVDEEIMLSEKAVHTWKLDVLTPATDLKVTLVYNDPAPEDPDTNERRLVHDLDLKVVSPPYDPDGPGQKGDVVDIYCGNHGLERGVSSIAVGTASPTSIPDCDDPSLFQTPPICDYTNDTFADCIGDWRTAMDKYRDSWNNVENVFLRHPPEGEWTIEVKAFDIGETAGQGGEPVQEVTFALVATGDSLAVPGKVENLGLGWQVKNESLKLEWAPDCGGGATYGIYRAPLTGSYDPASLAQEECDIASNSFVIAADAAAGSEYFLVVPNTGSWEGSYGIGKNEVERKQADQDACYPRYEIDSCGQ